MTAAAALELTQRLLGVTFLLAALEGIAARSALPGQGLLSWRLSRLQDRRLTVGRTGTVVGAVIGGRRVWWTLGIRAVAAATLLFTTNRWVAVAAYGVVLVLSLLAHIGVRQGHDGSDQISMIIGTAAMVASIVAPGSVAQQACLAFIGLQLLLSYCASGAAKLAGVTWRRGTAVADITSTLTYGSRGVARFFERWPGLGRALTWATVAFEATFPVVLVLPRGPAIAYLVVAAVFHLVVAAVMGLNTFVPAFVAGYPGVLWLHAQIHG